MQPTEAANDVISGHVVDYVSIGVCVKFCCSMLNHFRIYDPMLNFRPFFDNCQPEVASEVISGAIVDPASVDIRVKKLVIKCQTVLEILEQLTL